MVLAAYTFSDDLLSIYRVLFNSFLYFQRYATDKLNAAKRKGSNSVNMGDMAMVLAFCNFPYGTLAVYQVSFNYLLYFQRYTLDKFFITKTRKGSNSENTSDRVMVLALFNSPHNSLSVYQVLFNPLVYFLRYTPDNLFIAKIKMKVTLLILVTGLWFLHCAFLLMALYQYSKFRSIPLYTLRDMLRTSFLDKKIKREVTT